MADATPIRCLVCGTESAHPLCSSACRHAWIGRRPAVVMSQAVRSAAEKAIEQGAK